MGGGVGPVGDGAGLRRQVLPEGHGVRPRAQLLQKIGPAAVEGGHKGALIGGGHPQLGGVSGALDLAVAGHGGHQLPVGGVDGGVRQAAPGGHEVLRRDGPAVGPDDALPEGEGVGGVAGVVGLHRVALRLTGGQDGPAVAAVGPAHQVLIEVEKDGLPALGGDEGGVQGILGIPQADGQGAGPGLLAVGYGSVRRLVPAPAGGQRQQGRQQGRQDAPAPHRASAGTRRPFSSNFTG